MEQKNLALLRQGYRPPQISEESRFDAAQHDTRIADADEEQIREALRYCMVKIGLRATNFPQDLEKVLLIQHLYQMFPHLTIDEIRIAFDWAIEGRTEVEVNCYENFSCRYITTILKAYESLKAITLTKTQIERQRQLPGPEMPVNEPRKDMSYDDFLRSAFVKKLIRNGVNVPGYDKEKHG